MTAQGRTNRTTTVALSVIVVILAGSLVFVTAMPRTVTHTVTQTSTQTVVGTSSTSTSYYCIQTGIHGTLYVRVVADSTNQPISDANVTATITNYCTPNYQTNLGLTNSTGYSSEVDWAGNFIVSVVYAGTNYTFPALTSGAVSLVTLSIPSGITVEHEIACGLGCVNGTTTVTATATTTHTTTSAT